MEETLTDKKNLINLKVGILCGRYNYLIHVFLTYCDDGMAKVSVSVNGVKDSF